jgi:hypothetical protein
MTHLSQIARTVAAAALIGAATIASTIAPAEASGKTSPEQFARQICQSVIRVRPGVGQFDGCVSSLTDSAQSISRGRAVAQARDVCFAQGLKRGSADLSLCLLKAADTRPGPDAIELPDPASVVAVMTDDTQSSKSYFAVSSDTKIHREQEACARLGFDPAYAAFANCVANLQSTLQGIDMSGG